MSNATKLLPERLVRSLAEQAGFRHDAGIQEMISNLYLDPDEKDAQDITELAHFFQTQIRFEGRTLRPFGINPPGELLRAGELFAGHLMDYDERVLLSVKGHIGVFASTQVGKSTLAKLMMASALQRGLSVIVNDPEGEYARHIGGLLPPEDCYIVDDRSYLVNPFEPPPGVTALNWIGILGNIDREAWFYRRGSEDFSNRTKLEVLSRGQELNLESFYRAVLDAKPSGRDFRENEWFQSVRSVVETIRDFLPALRTRRSAGLDKIFSKRLVIFDWSGLQNMQLKRYLTLHAMNWLYAMRLYQRANAARRTIIFWDEVSQVASKNIQNLMDLAEPFIVGLMRTAMKRGFCFVIIDQSPATLLPVCRGSVRTKIVMELDGGHDMDAMASDMNLTQDQRAYLGALQPREAVVKTLFIPDPFLIRIPEVQFE
jgi:hypothetical protein